MLIRVGQSIAIDFNPAQTCAPGKPSKPFETATLRLEVLFKRKNQQTWVKTNSGWFSLSFKQLEKTNAG